MKRTLIYILAMAGSLMPAIVSCSGPEKTATTNYSTAWRPDTLGDGYEMRYVTQPNDYSGAIRSTIIRKKSPCGSKRGVLYIHGFNDYFFQTEMGNRFVDSCYSFYAVDLRKYGRSIMPGQKPFQVRDMSEYYPDIDSAIVQMHRDSIDEIILMGHSTGGLTTSLYLNQNQDSTIKALILNSPFLDWRLSPALEKYGIPTVDMLGALFPGLKISQGNSKRYSKSLLKKYGGEWDYDTIWKLESSPDVDAGWVRAIEEGQEKLHHASDISVPILLLHSDSTYNKGDNPERDRRSDIVLDVNDISLYGKRLGPDVTEATIKDGIHDLVLSRKSVRDSVYVIIFDWLKNNVK